jgi:hypothetical protein
LRERCFGPATITTTIATTHHTTARIHDCLTESAPENIGEKKLPEDGVVHGVHQHDDQHAPVGAVEHPVVDDDSGEHKY